MKIKHHIPNSKNNQISGLQGYVGASAIAADYDVTPRYILKLAAEKKIPSLRLGKKCVRFDREAVAIALENKQAND